MKKIKSHTFLGKKYKIEWLSPSKLMGGTAYAAVDHPDTKNKKIQFSNDIKSSRELEIALHEILHIFSFEKSEKDVTQFAKDMAKFLKRLGYIKLEKDETIVKKNVN